MIHMSYILFKDKLIILALYLVVGNSLNLIKKRKKHCLMYFTKSFLFRSIASFMQKANCKTIEQTLVTKELLR